MNKKIMIGIVVIALTVMIFNFSSIFAFGSFDVNNVNDKASTNESIGTADNAVKRVWGTVVLILQVLAVAAIVFAGVRYMFASADTKADIKKQMITLVIGAILVFAASSIIGFIVNITNEIAGGSNIKKNSDGTYTRYSDYDGDGINDWADTITKGTPDILNPSCASLNGALDRWKLDHSSDDPVYGSK